MSDLVCPTSVFLTPFFYLALRLLPNLVFSYLTFSYITCTLSLSCLAPPNLAPVVSLTLQQCMVPDVNYNPANRQSVGRQAVAAFITLRCLVTGRRVTVANMRMVPEYKNRPDIQAAQVETRDVVCYA